MEYLTQFNLALVLLGFLIGVTAIIFGASMFLSAPLFMYLFPEATLGQIVGNIKLGSVVRNFGATLRMRRDIDWIAGLNFSWPFVLGAILGATLISELNQKWLLPMVVIAILVSEFGEWLRKFDIPQGVYFLAAFAAGIYAGFLGIGLSVLLIALLRLQHPEDSKIAWVKIQSVFLELIISIAAIATHFVNKNIIFEMWFFWTIGGFFGGLVGGELLRRMVGVGETLQRLILRGTYVFALVAASMVFVFDWNEIAQLWSTSPFATRK